MLIKIVLHRIACYFFVLKHLKNCRYIPKTAKLIQFWGFISNFFLYLCLKINIEGIRYGQRFYRQKAGN